MAVENISRNSGQVYETTEVNMQNERTTENVSDVSASDEARNSGRQDTLNENVSIPSLHNKELQKAISEFKKKINPNTVAEFGIHEPTNRITIKIVDKDTDKVIKEYPPEKTLEMIAKVWELAGIMVDKKL